VDEKVIEKGVAGELMMFRFGAWLEFGEAEEAS
jgi:hypothetical protein